MRDTALAWIDQKVAWGEQTFTVDEVVEISDCTEPGRSKTKMISPLCRLLQQYRPEADVETF